MDKVLKAANMYLAYLRAMYLIHQHSHWTAKGVSFYGDHLLFQRIYESAAENADGAAEKVLGVFGEDGVDFSMQKDLIFHILKKYEKYDGDPTTMSLTIEKDFLKLSKEVYDLFEQNGKMTLGLDDFLMSVASKREEAVYLLSQKHSE